MGRVCSVCVCACTHTYVCIYKEGKGTEEERVFQAEQRQAEGSRKVCVAEPRVWEGHGEKGGYCSVG